MIWAAIIGGLVVNILTVLVLALAVLVVKGQDTRIGKDVLDFTPVAILVLMPGLGIWYGMKPEQSVRWKVLFGVTIAVLSLMFVVRLLVRQPHLAS